MNLTHLRDGQSLDAAVRITDGRTAGSKPSPALKRRERSSAPHDVSRGPLSQRARVASQASEGSRATARETKGPERFGARHSQSERSSDHGRSANTSDELRQSTIRRVQDPDRSAREALECVRDMRTAGVPMDSSVTSAIVTKCRDAQDFDTLRIVLALIVEDRVPTTHASVRTALRSTFTFLRTRNPKKAHALMCHWFRLKGALEAELRIYTSLILKDVDLHAALGLVRRTIEAGAPPDAYLITALLKKCKKEVQPAMVAEVLALTSDELKKVDEVQKALIGAWSVGPDAMLAHELVCARFDAGKATVDDVRSVSIACMPQFNLPEIERCRQALSKRAIDLGNRLATALITALCRCEAYDLAEAEARRAADRVTHETLAAQLAIRGQAGASLATFDEMRVVFGWTPSIRSYQHAIFTCKDEGLAERAEFYLIEMIARHRVLGPVRSLNIVLFAWKMSETPGRAHELFDRLRPDCEPPTGLTYETLVSACFQDNEFALVNFYLMEAVSKKQFRSDLGYDKRANRLDFQNGSVFVHTDRDRHALVSHELVQVLLAYHCDVGNIDLETTIVAGAGEGSTRLMVESLMRFHELDPIDKPGEPRCLVPGPNAKRPPRSDRNAGTALRSTPPRASGRTRGSR